MAGLCVITPMDGAGARMGKKELCEDSCLLPENRVVGPKLAVVDWKKKILATVAGGVHWIF